MMKSACWTFALLSALTLGSTPTLSVFFQPPTLDVFSNADQTYLVLTIHILLFHLSKYSKHFLSFDNFLSGTCKDKLRHVFSPTEKK